MIGSEQRCEDAFVLQNLVGLLVLAADAILGFIAGPKSGRRGQRAR